MSPLTCVRGVDAVALPLSVHLVPIALGATTEGVLQPGSSCSSIRRPSPLRQRSVELPAHAPWRVQQVGGCQKE